MIISPLHTPVPHLYGPQDADEVRQQIDKDIQDLEDSVRQLKTRRNALAPVSRLPNELLYKIFTTFAGLEQSDYINGTDISWIRPITAVCSHWRAVALECPRLWSSIIFSRPSWAAEMLKRSKMAPLIIKADLTYLTPKMVDAVQMALQHVSRIRELHLTASKATMEKLIDNLNEPAPLLQSLCLSNPRYSHFLLDDGYTLPVNLFEHGRHHLQRLELVKCNVKWDSPLLNGLIHVKLHKTSTMSRPSIAQLLGALERMPRLETLDMEDSLPFLSDDASATYDSGRVVNLSCLSLLRLSSGTLEIAFLLRHLSYPPTTSLNLRCLAEPSTDYNFSCIFPAISFIGSGSEGSKPLQSLIILSMSPKSIRIAAWTASGCTDETTSAPQIDLELHWYTIREDRAETVMVEVCNSLPLSRLRTLSVYHLVQVAKNSWLNPFGRLASLRSVHVRGPAAFGLALALSAEMSKDEGGQQLQGKTVFFPTLRKLLIEDTDFGDEMRTENFFEDLLDCLMDRCESKAEIRELHLVECSRISEAEVALLKELVVDVVWDGIEQSPEDEDEDESGDSFDSIGWGFPFFAPDDELDAESYLTYGPF